MEPKRVQFLITIYPRATTRFACWVACKSYEQFFSFMKISTVKPFATWTFICGSRWRASKLILSRIWIWIINSDKWKIHCHFFNRSYNFSWHIPPQRTWPSRSLLPIVLFTDWNGQSSIRLRAVPHFSSGIVERAKRERAWKSPHARKGDTRRGDRKMRDYRLSPSFWTNALFPQRKTLIGSSMEICQHLSKTRQPLSTLDIITIYRTNN